MLTIGLIREEKEPHDKRVAFTPLQCRRLIDEHPGTTVLVQPSAWRCYADGEYRAAGIPVTEDLSACDLLMGIKEVPPACLAAGKKYLFFSHTIKHQPRNRDMLRTILDRQIELIDYECLVDEDNNRVIGFGRFAGLVGAYNAVMAYGLKYDLYHLRPAHTCRDKEDVFRHLKEANLPNVKITVTGSGRVGNGASEMLGSLNIRKVTPYEFLNYSFREPVYVQLHSGDYYESKSNAPFSSSEFHRQPESFRCRFSDTGSYATVTDILIHCAYWDPHADILFTRKRMKDPDFRISVIADVTCDLNGSIPSTTRTTTIEDKFYGYDPLTERETDPLSGEAIMVMAIDNLPCELPRDASEGFGKHLLERVMPLVIGEDNGMIRRATIARQGRLTERYAHLLDYVR